MEFCEKIATSLEKEGWIVLGIEQQDGQFYVELENCSPAGEDLVETIWFDGTDAGFVEALQQHAENFDADAHAEMWVGHRGKNGVPGTIQEILNDADATQQMLTSVAEAVDTAWAA